MSQKGIDGYSYYISNDSDEELPSGSSDEEVLDEVNVFLRGTPEQKKKALKCLTGDEASSSDDDFEKVMQGELQAKISALENSWKTTVSNNPECASEKDSAQSSDASKRNFYDDIYFDSDEEENTEKGKKKKMTDEELLYDPEADEEDQKWIDMQRSRHKHTDGRTEKIKESKTGGSDAILTCPACMSTLCVDCQKHSIYQNQYRAMFVMNCDIKFDELLRYKTKKKREFRRHKKRRIINVENDANLSSSSFAKTESNGENLTDGYHPVICTTCKTEVAVYDSDEIYHFFNVLSGYA